MANYRSANDLKLAVLKKCGELLDGTSDYDSRAVEYLTAAHQNLLAGGNEFGIDCGENWAWARARKPIVLTLQAPISSGSLTVVQGLNAGSFMTVPVDAQGNQVSVQGWYLKVDGIDDYYKIAYHLSGATAFSLDQGFLGLTGSYSTWKVIKLDYDLFDDTLVVDTSNNKIDFKGTGGSALVATLTSGVYTPQAYITMVASALQSADTGTYTGSWDTLTRKFTLAHGGATFSFTFGSGANVNYSASASLGFDVADTTAATSYTSTYVINGIQRLAGPMVMYRESVMLDWQSNKDAGKIFGLSSDAMKADYPIARLSQGVPDKFAVLAEHDNGLLTVRFNSYPASQIRVEVDHIPIGRDLQDNVNSIPLVPISFREYLMHVAVYYLMLDKSDNRADLEGNIAKAKLVALINHNRKTTKASNKDYGRLIPRSSQRRMVVRSTET